MRLKINMKFHINEVITNESKSLIFILSYDCTIMNIH